VLAETAVIRIGTIAIECQTFLAGVRLNFDFVISTITVNLTASQPLVDELDISDSLLTVIAATTIENARFSVFGVGIIQK
jgi:hypothetical protein